MAKCLNRTVSIVLGAVLALLALAEPACAQSPYPNRPIRIVVPFTPGTGIDVLARVIGQGISERLKVPVVVENLPGASGVIGTQAVAKAAPDGYTLLLTANTHVINAALQPSVPYDPAKSFTPIGPVAVGNLALVVHPAVPARSVQQLVALAKSEPGKLLYASPGSGTPHHLAMELFKAHFKVDLTHVPYKGTAGAITDLLSGQVQSMFLPVHVALSHVRAGKLRMLTAGGAHRSPATPEMPSLAEEGVNDVDVDMWYALLAPAGLPENLVALVNSETNAVLANPQVRDQLLQQGLNPTPGKPAKLARAIDTDLKRWTKIIQAAGIKSE